SGAAQRPPGAVKGHIPGFDGLVALDHYSCLRRNQARPRVTDCIYPGYPFARFWNNTPSGW
ncbi:MAG: hypothetical protein WA376_15900, partial [Terrimicrobiaceae bacterium]